MYSEKKQALAAELSLKRPAVLAVSGAHNSGKTTLLEKLIPLLRARGLKVGVIKHDGHDFTPDVPGTDSFRLREAGAEGVAVYSGTRYLLTEALPHDQPMDAVRPINPFLVTPNELDTTE